MVALPLRDWRPRAPATIAGLAWRRMRANVRWSAALALGMLAAATLLAVAPIYHRAMVDLGLRDAIAENLIAPTDAQGLYPYEDAAIREPRVGLIRVEFAGIPVNGADAKAFGERVQGEVEKNVGWLATSYGSYTRVGGIIGYRPGERTRPISDTYVQALPGWQQRVRVLDGRLPADTAPGGVYQVAISERGSQLSGLKPGDRFELVPPCAGGLDSCDPVPTVVTAEVTAIVEPIVPLDSFWAAGFPQYLEPFFTDSNPGIVLPVLMDDTPYQEFLAGLPDGATGYRAWYAFADPGGLSRGTVNRALAGVDEVELALQREQALAFSPMAFTVGQFEKDADHQRAPITILLLEIAAIALFYLVLVGSAAMERQSREIAVLRSRGTSAMQVLGGHFIEAALIAAAVIVAAPLLAMGAIALLGTTPVFDEVTGGEPLDVTLLPSAFLLAAGGAALGMLAVLVPAAIAARRGLVAQRQSEARPTRSFFQRYYLDVIVTFIALLLLWELNERGSVYEPSSTGGVSSDPLLLASPALLVFAGAMIFLRFYPIVLRGLAWLALRGPGVSTGMALSHLVRRPGQYAQLALLLLIAVSIGTFAASYSKTTDRSLADRAAFEAGVDWRAFSEKEGNMGSNGPATDAMLRDLPHQSAATAVLRTEANASLSGDRGRGIQLLSIDPAAAQDLVWFREDFAEKPLDQVLAPLRAGDELPGILLPGNPTRFSGWIWTPEPRELTTVWVRLEDANGVPALVDLGALDYLGWRELSGEVTSATPLVAPIRLTGLILTSPPTRGFTSGNASLIFDDFAVISSDGRATVVEDFESATPRWQALATTNVNPDQFSATNEQKHGGARAGKISLGSGTTTATRGIYPSTARVPIPIAASEQLLGELGLAEGGLATLLVGDVPVPVVVRSAYKLFPTLRSAEGASAVIGREDLNAWLRTWAVTQRVEMNEAWFDLPAGTSIEARKELETTLSKSPFLLEEVTDHDALLADIDDNPLLAAGGTGILTLGFISTLVLLAAAAAVVLFTGAERRKGEFAVMRALGYSRGQVARMLALEYGLLVALGIGLGAVLGRLLGGRMLTFLNVTEEGERVEPEFILETDWALLAASAGVIVASFAVVLALTLLISRRTSTAQSLRVE